MTSTTTTTTTTTDDDGGAIAGKLAAHPPAWTRNLIVNFEPSYSVTFTATHPDTREAETKSVTSEQLLLALEVLRQLSTVSDAAMTNVEACTPNDVDLTLQAAAYAEILFG